MHRFLRPATVAAVAVGCLVVWPSAASAEVEIGGSAGIHVFSKTNELGVNDIPNANSERNSAMFAVRLGWFFTPIFGVEGEFGVVPTEARRTVFDVWDITYRAHLVAQFSTIDPKGKFVPFVFVGGGAFQIVDNGGSKNDGQIFKDTDALLYAGAGLKYRVDNGWGLRLDARILFPPSSSDNSFTEDFEALLSIYKEFGRAKPVKVEPKVIVNNDPDNDGIGGDADRCPNEAEDKDGFQDDDGCPDLDNDGDGVPDATDKCPNEPEDKDGFQDDDGCPDPDNDGDGVPDATDKCPGQAEDKDGFQDDDGCPDPDNDNDGVPDATDKCPNDPETKNGYQDEDGCPDELPTQLKKYSGVIKGIKFRTGDTTLQGSNAALDEAVAVLKEYGDLKLEIQGHTDDQPLRPGGKFADNQALSQARADTVKAYLVNKGIDASRLTAKGYGDTVPLESVQDLKGDKLAAARAKNRRVEFNLVGSLPPP